MPVVFVMIWMIVAPVPVLRLFLPIRLRVFVRIPVILGEVRSPGAIFIVVPVVIILVAFIVHADLNAFLRCGRGHDRQRRGKGSGHKERSEVKMWTVHVVSRVRVSAEECGSHNYARRARLKDVSNSTQWWRLRMVRGI